MGEKLGGGGRNSEGLGGGERIKEREGGEIWWWWDWKVRKINLLR